MDDYAFLALLLLSLGGMAVADYSASSGLTYWLWMIPLFTVVSVSTAWSRARGAKEKVPAVLLRQLLHWGALVLAVYLVYLLERTGRLNREDAGLVAMLSLALTTVLAGVHFDWRLAVLGILLALATAGAALVEEFFWILLLPTLIAGGALLLWSRRKEKT
jgi:hypothetical protein